MSKEPSGSDLSWALTQMSLESLSEDTRKALWAVSIPEWFTAETIGALCPNLKTSPQEVYEQLQKLSFVEPWTDRGWNIHEATRKELIEHYPETEFFEMFDRVVDHFEGDDEEEEDDEDHVRWLINVAAWNKRLNIVLKRTRS